MIVKNKALVIAVASLLFNCQDKVQNLDNQDIQTEVPNPVSDSVAVSNSSAATLNSGRNSKEEIDRTYEEGRQWLKTAIEEEFNNASGNLENLCTKQYAEFKTDAMGMEYDGGLSNSQFKKKWKGKYNLDLVTKGSFLLGLQDYTQIKVTSVEPKKNENNEIWYAVKIKDIGFSNIVSREIRIVKNGSSFLIDEVLERD